MPKCCLPLTELSWTSIMASCPSPGRECIPGWFYIWNEIWFFFSSLIIFIPKHNAGFSSQPDLSCCYWIYFPSRPHFSSSAFLKRSPGILFLCIFHMSLMCLHRFYFSFHLFRPSPTICWILSCPLLFLIPRWICKGDIISHNYKSGFRIQREK